MRSDLTVDYESPESTPEVFPDAIADGSTLVCCGFDPTKHALGLRALRRFGAAGDSAVVVTTERGVEATVADYTELDDGGSPAISVVDMVSEGQSIEATYGDVPTIFTPSVGDTERLVIALSELTSPTPIETDRHLLVRSLSPILETAAADQVGDVVERISGLRTQGGLALFGLDYTRHSERTVTQIASSVDRVLWVSRGADGAFSADLRSTRAIRGQPEPE